MKTKGSRFRWIACIATLLLLCIVSSDKPEMGAEQSVLPPIPCAYIAEDTSDDATISNPENDIFTHQLNTNRWGLSSNTLHLRVPASRTLSFSHLSQRIVRIALAYLCGHTTTEQLNHTQCHTIASIRFHIGYFIYHRCQMIC